MLEPLIDILCEPDTVLFIGSGISNWSHLPTWSGLLEELAVYLETQNLDPALLRREVANGDLLLAASFGFDKLTAPQKTAFLRSACRLDSAKPDDIHQKLLNLGPTCFVTTNYDRLLEQSFAQWPLDAPVRTVLNTQFTEHPNITQGSATHFLYKLHGDVGDLRSVVLTREHYASLEVNGDLHAAQRTLETLMMSRPFLYLGFGLKDPDFVRLTGQIAKLYQHTALRSYAILAGVTDDEKAYYSRQLGLQLFSYPLETANGRPSHRGLSDLLDQLTAAAATNAARVDERLQLRLARYASRVTNVEKADPHIPLLASARDQKAPPIPVETLLDAQTGQFMLIGSSGGGKSYAMRNSAARLAAELAKAIIGDTFQANDIPVPVMADLKLYRGDLVQLLEETLPAGWQFGYLQRRFKLRIYLDAFNELPHRYQQHWATEFPRFLRRIGPADLVISSRSDVGLESFGLAVHSLDRIDRQFIQQQLAAAGIVPKGALAQELISTLQIPIFYKLFRSLPGEIGGNTAPHKLYASLLTRLDTRFMERFGHGFDLEPALSLAATEAYHHGREAFPLEILEHHLSDALNAAGIQTLTALDLIQWLISQEFLIPFPGRLISFLHQSVTEYLVAGRLALDFEQDPNVLKDKFRNKSWDNVILLTLSFLPEKKAERFITAILKIDFDFALSAVRYLEGGNKDLLTAMLIRTAAGQQGHFFSSWKIIWNLPLNETHIALIRELIARGHMIGGHGVALLANILGQTVKTEVFQLLLDHCTDPWFCQQMAQALAELVTDPADLPRLRTLAGQAPYAAIRREHDNTAFAQAIGLAIIKFEPDLVTPLFYDPHRPIHQRDVYSDIYTYYLTYSRRPDHSIRMAAAMMLQGDHRALKVLSSVFTNTQPETPFDLSPFTAEHCRFLSGFLKTADINLANSAILILRKICAGRSDLHPDVLAAAAGSRGMVKAAIHYCLSPATMFEPLESLLAMDHRTLQKEPTHLAENFLNVDWQGHEPLLLKLLGKRNVDLAGAISFGITFSRTKYPLTVEIGDIYWWLAWFREIATPNYMKYGAGYLEPICSLITYVISDEKRAAFIAEFNDPASPYRRVLMQTIIQDLEDLTTGELSEDTITFLLDKKSSNDYEYAHRILYHIADETLVNTHLLPRLKTATGNHRRELRSLLASIGDKHGIRYL